MNHKPTNAAWMLAVMVLLSAGARPSSAGVVFVSTSGDDGNDGLSWATAKGSVQAGLDAATAGDQVWVAAGTYVENITLALGVGLYGGFAGDEDPGTFDLGERDSAGNETVLDGNHARSVVTSPASATGSTRIDGFIIRNGLAVYGGGIDCSDSSPTIAHNIIESNEASYSGGGIQCRTSSATISNCVVEGNIAYLGGAIYCVNASPIIKNTVITANGARNGGGIYVSSSSNFVRVINSTITGNGGNDGAAIHARGLMIVANTIVAFNASGLHWFGSGTLTLRHNCVFGNLAYNYDGVTDPSGTDGNISVDPLLADSTYGNSHIESTSPCVNAGDNSYASGSSDIDDQSRIIPAGGIVDIGADESDGTVWPEGPYTVVRVAPDGDDTHDGSSWSQAKQTVQAGINAAFGSGGEVWVQSGTYRERITVRPHTHLYGGFAGTEDTRHERNWWMNRTILDGQTSGSVIGVRGGLYVSRIDGFIICNGSALHGGGIYCRYSSPWLMNNTITKNTASKGGGIYCDDSFSTIANSIITGNGAGSGGGIYVDSGGGTHTPGTLLSSVTIANNTIVANTAMFGGGIASSYSSSTVANTIVAFNSSGLPGSETMTLRNNCVFGNKVYDYSGDIDHTGTNGNISTDPRLADVAYGNMHIQPNSPCVDSGSNAYAPGDRDIDGQLRVQPASGTVDIGADECDGTVWTEGPYTIVRVAPEGHDGNDGSSWAVPKQTVQAGIETASKLGGEVWIREGTYQEQLSLEPFTYIYGGFYGTETSREERDSLNNTTTLDGQDEGSVVIARGGFQVSIIDGFTIRNGLAPEGGGILCQNSSPTIRNNTISANHAAGSGSSGGGIHCRSSFPTISDNTIMLNRAERGAGIYSDSSSSTITYNSILENSASTGGGIYLSGSSTSTVIHNVIMRNAAIETIYPGGTGGGIYISDTSSSMIANNMIVGNSATSSGGGIDLSGPPMIVNNTIASNSAPFGGGISMHSKSSFPLIINNVIRTNSASSSGGGIFCPSRSLPTIVNTAIVGNSAVESGGGIHCWGADLTATECTFAANVAANGPALAFDSFNQNSPGTATVVNSVIWNSAGWLWNNDSSTVTVNYSNVQGGWPGVGNIDVYPLFVRMPDAGADGVWGTEDDDYGNLRLRAGSPCIDAGDNATVPADLADLDGDGDVSEPVPVDLAGYARFVDDPLTVDTGAGDAPIVDMGAYEYFSTVGADFDYDGDVDGDDVDVLRACASGPAVLYDPLALAVGCWLAADGDGRIAADLDGDGDVDHVDFGRFQRCHSGEGVVADPGCDD